MASYIIGGIVGFLFGAAFQRFVIYMAVNTISPTTCDYCRWKKENEWRWQERKDRHKKPRP